MPVNNSSVLGASLTAPDTTKLFALGTKLNATDGSDWVYVEATQTLTTGYLVQITPNGTAFSANTGRISSPSTVGLNWGAAQFTISQGEFGFVAQRGYNLYLLCTGTIAAGTGVGLDANSGRLIAMAAAGVGTTLAGIHITTSASTATASVAVGSLIWPRSLTTAGVVS